MLQAGSEYSQSPKRTADGEQIFYSTMKKKRKGGVRTVIVELADLEKEYLLVLARLKLVQHGKSESVAIGESEIFFVTLLSKYMTLFGRWCNVRRQKRWNDFVCL